jgi:hypothetical protein
LGKLTKILLLLLIGMSLGGAVAQNSIDSPYSRFGLGMLESNSVNVQLRAMGGIGNAIGSQRIVNSANPATYAAFDSLSFLFDAGLSLSTVGYRTTTQTESGNYANLAYFAAGFPVTAWWKSAVGLQPFSHISYEVNAKSTTNEGLDYIRSYSGEGGLNKLYFGNAFALVKNVSIGVNASYVFGRNTTSSLVYFTDSLSMANTKVDSRMMVSDFIIDYGALYSLRFQNDMALHFGLIYSHSTNLAVKGEQLVVSRFGGIGDNIPQLIDTIFYDKKQKETIQLPPKVGFGLSLEKPDSWLVGLDFNWQNWEAYPMPTSVDSLGKSWNLSVGGQFTPSHTSISGYWKRVTYRMGAQYNQTYLQLNGHQITDFGISFGVSLPMPRSLTTLDLSLEVGRRGTMADNLIRETYANLTVGIAIYERWFVKRKYN